MKPIESAILTTLSSAFAPHVLNIENESDMHHGPPGRESHFKVFIVSDQFKDKGRVERQRLVFAALNEIMPKVHALALRALTVDEYEKSQSEFNSPQCASRTKN